MELDLFNFRISNSLFCLLKEKTRVDNKESLLDYCFDSILSEQVNEQAKREHDMLKRNENSPLKP